MRTFFIFILFFCYFEAGIATTVFFSDRVCSVRDDRCHMVAIGTGVIWPAYWSVLTWREILS